MSDLKTPFQLLELNVISAQELEPICRRRKMRTYAVAWVHSERKLSTRIDNRGDINPTWNDKFIFKVDEEFLYRETSAIMIEIYAVHWFRDIHVGTVRAIIGNLIPHIASRPNRRDEVQLGTTFVALQVWRPSGRPQGILNIGVTLIDSSKRSMPLYLQMGSSAIGYKHLMGEEEYPVSTTSKSNDNENPSPLPKPKLRRTKSDSSSVFPCDLQPKIPTKGSSIINGGSVVNGGGGGGSMVNGFEPVKRGGSMLNYPVGNLNPGKGKSGSEEFNQRGSSMVNFPVSKITCKKVASRGSSMVNYTVGKLNPRKGKSSSVVNGTEDPGRKSRKGNSNSSSVVNGSEDPGKGRRKGKSRSGSVVNGLKKPLRKSPNGSYVGAPRKAGREKAWTDSEVGPSPSEVAASMAKNMHHNNRFDDCESSILGWSIEDDDSIEGLRSKLEQWRNELTPVRDWRSDGSSSWSGSSIPSSERRRHARRHSDGGGSFACFGNICGCQISITCGGGGGEEATGNRRHRAPDSSIADDMSYI
ncbi:Auxin-responsive protein IAA13, putative isoform 1 [Hibiscus syriacus]|uniref:Auxin-responsive protein IAA13, putative isoform 1 n=1 Tax=Hibiscus syriacus TaxID=106335 RepID=A0A6A3D2X2_HIBSY|nr:uncharacterized protein LOC120208691 [Hibiscus syriacus]KAE8734954.1 Auxin-responsive protein IAA13, putative isoform 1 [Hibiscus syriacus]